MENENDHSFSNQLKEKAEKTNKYNLEERTASFAVRVRDFFESAKEFAEC